MNFRKSHPLVNIVNGVLIDLPTPSNISVHWNYGSLLGLMLIIQLATGLILATRFTAFDELAFDTVILVSQDTYYGWLFRLAHSTGATFFFICIYMHIGRGLYYGSYIYSAVWNIGVVIYLLLIGTAFLGYVLPWGQMSYWGATVITNLLTVIPYAGSFIVEWVWGGFSVGNATLTRFFTLHYLMPFLITVLVGLHIFNLHASGSNNPLGVDSNAYNVSFHYYYSVNDLFLYFVFAFAFFIGTFKYGYSFIDAVNWIPANPMVTPTHIQPEWYFLCAYAILRAVPNNAGGVIALLASVTFLFLFSLESRTFVYSGAINNPLSRVVFWSLVVSWITLTWLGSCPAEAAYTTTSQIFSFFFFFSAFLLIVHPHLSTIWYFSQEDRLVTHVLYPQLLNLNHPNSLLSVDTSRVL